MLNQAIRLENSDYRQPFNDEQRSLYKAAVRYRRSHAVTEAMTPISKAEEALLLHQAQREQQLEFMKHPYVEETE